MLDTMGRVYQNLGLSDSALELLQEASAVRRELRGNDLELASSLNSLAGVLYAKGRLSESRGELSGGACHSAGPAWG